jgi:hypothetical protein
MTLATANCGSTIPDMAKKKTNKPGRPSSGRTPTTTIFARVPPDLGKAIDDYLDSLRPAPTLTAIVRVALEEFLQAKGFWPPTGKPKP